MPRRTFIQAAIAASAVARSLGADHSSVQAAPSVELTDTNVYLDHWPMRHMPLAEPSTLAAKLKAHRVTEAWASSLDALFHKDLAGVNSRTAEACAAYPIFKPIGSVNPTLPCWEDDIERCATKHHMRGIRLHPNYHNYTLDDPRFTELLKLATAKKLFVQIAVGLEDERTQNPLLRVVPVDLRPLVKALTSVPEARVMLLNWQRSTGGKPTVGVLKDTPVMFDIALVEGIMALEGLLEELPVERIVFGSFAPIFYFEAAKLKLQESALDAKQLAAISHENAARFIG